MPTVKVRRSKNHRPVCNHRLAHAQVVLATIEAAHIFRNKGIWKRTGLRMPKVRCRVPLILLCGSCGAAQEHIPSQILRVLSAPLAGREVRHDRIAEPARNRKFR